MFALKSKTASTITRVRAGRVPPAQRPQVVVNGVAWPIAGAQVAIVDRGRVLVQFRPFPPGWELPGGHVEADEDPAVSAAREVEEETGLSVRILGLVGVYSWRGLRTVGDALYLGEITGGQTRRTLEAWSTRFVAPSQMPRTIFPWCRQRIFDAVARAEGAAPVHRAQDVTAYHVATFATAWMRTPYDTAMRWLRRTSNP